MKAERRARFNRLAKRLKAMSESEKIDLVASRGIVNTEGKELSLNNTVLLLFQSNGTVPTVVGGYRQWQREHRQVTKGQHGMMIWFPVFPARDDDTEEDQRAARFFIGTVFDISQTQERPGN